MMRIGTLVDVVPRQRARRGATVASSLQWNCRARIAASLWFSWLVLWFAALTLLTSTGCHREHAVAKSAQDSDSVTEFTAETLAVEQKTWPVIVRCQGTLYADETAAIGTRVPGRIAAVHVDLGDKVKAGTPLVTLETDEFELLVSQAQAQLAQARSAVGLDSDELIDHLDPENSPPVRQQRAVWNEAKASLERARRLLEQNAISQGEYDLAASAEQVAEASFASALNSVREQLSIIGVRRVELALAKQRLKDAVICAPFDGLVQNRRAAPGTYVNPGDALVSLVRADPIWFRGTLPERYAAQVAEGLEISISIQSVQEPVRATITRVSPSLDLASRSLAFEAKIENSEQRLRSGLFAHADVVLDPTAQSLVIPVSAISEFAGAEKVWKLIDGVAQQFEIATGMRRDGFVEILDGLAGGDTILTDASIGRVARVIPQQSATQVAEAATGDEVTPTPPTATLEEEVAVSAIRQAAAPKKEKKEVGNLAGVAAGP